MANITAREATPATARSGDVAEVRWLFLTIAPLLAAANFVGILDRNALSYAALTMGGALHLSPSQLGLGFACFTLGYLIFDIPSGLAYGRFGLAPWLARIMLTWGGVTMLMAAMRGPLDLYGLRFLLGAAEAGFISGMVLMVASRFPERVRARALSWVLIANPIAGSVAGPLAIAIFSLDGKAGLAGWQWLFVLEGGAAVLLGLVFLTLREPAGVATDAAPADAGPPAIGLGEAVRHGRFWLLGLAYAGSLGPMVTLNHWTALIVRDLGFSVTLTGFLAVIPQVSGLVGMLLLAGVADRRRNPRDFIVAALVLTAAGLAMAAVVSASWLKLAGLATAGFSVYAAQPIFWSIPTALVGGRKGGGAFAFISACGVGGLSLTQWLIGVLREQTGSFNTGVAMILGLALVAAVLIRAIVPRDLLKPGGDPRQFWKKRQA